MSDALEDECPMTLALQQEIPYDLLKALAGDPLLLAASDEQRLRRRIIACLTAFANWTTEDVELLGHVSNVPKAQLEALSRGPNERLLTALKNWDEEWGEVARHDSYAAPWDRELGQAIAEWRTTATSLPVSESQQGDSNAR